MNKKISITNAAVIVRWKPRTHPTFVGPVGEPVHYVALLIGAGQTQRFAGGARHVVDIAVEDVRLERTEETGRVAGVISG